MSVSLKNAVENHLTAKPPRAQYPVGALRTYRKIKRHLFGEAIDRLDIDSDLCFSWRLCVFAVKGFIPTSVSRVSQTSRSAGMTLIETLVSLALASMLLIAMWTWQASQMRNGKHALAHAQALRDAMSCSRLLSEDAAFLITVPEGSLQVSDQNHISLVTGSVIPGHPRGFRRVEYQWSAAKGLTRTDNGVARWYPMWFLLK